MQPFERDKLYVSIVAALGHRSDAVTASSAITATVIAKLLKTAQGACVTREAICNSTASTLQAFDTAGEVQYRAYHK
jgi:ADP-ribosylglycohydrolase